MTLSLAPLPPDLGNAWGDSQTPTPPAKVAAPSNGRDGGELSGRSMLHTRRFGAGRMSLAGGPTYSVRYETRRSPGCAGTSVEPEELTVGRGDLGTPDRRPGRVRDVSGCDPNNRTLNEPDTRLIEDRASEGEDSAISSS